LKARYGITEEGHAVLRRWLAEPGAPPAMQFEGLLKVLLADATQRDAADASLAEAIRWADSLQDIGRLVAAEYATGQGPFQERAHLVALSFAYLWDYAEFVRRWASWARQEIRRPPGDGPPGVFRRALDGSPVVPGRPVPGSEQQVSRPAGYVL